MGNHPASQGTAKYGVNRSSSVAENCLSAHTLVGCDLTRELRRM